MDPSPPSTGWRLPPALGESARSSRQGFRVRSRRVSGESWLRSGPGYLVAVGYMDPGNWATDLAGGSRFNYALPAVIMISNLMAILLPGLAARWASSRARSCAGVPRPFRRPVPISAVDCVRDRDRRVRLGGSHRLGDRAQSLFGIPLIWGVLLTAFDVMILLLLQNRGFRWLESRRRRTARVDDRRLLCRRDHLVEARVRGIARASCRRGRS